METFTFGKYKGYKVDTIIEINPKYALWADQNVSFFSLTEEQRNMANSLVRKSFRPTHWYYDDFDDDLYDDSIDREFEDDLRACFDPNL